MILALPALVIWYLAIRLRRTWAGVGVVGLGIGVLALLGLFVRKLHLVVNFEVNTRPFLLMWWGETAVVAAVGVFILMLPRRVRDEWHCASCGYDMRGLDEAEMCPECGGAWKTPGASGRSAAGSSHRAAAHDSGARPG